MLPEFTRTSGVKVATGSGASQGTGPQTIAAQLARGVPADVVILSREGLSELIAENRITAGTDVDLAQVPLGVKVRAGATKPDVSTVETFRQTLLRAERRRAGKYQRHLADERAFSAARDRGKNRRQVGPRAPTRPAWWPPEWLLSRSCRSAKSHTRQVSIAPAASRRRFSSFRCFRRRCRRHGGTRRVRTTDRVSRLGSRVRSNQETAAWSRSRRSRSEARGGAM